MRVATGRVDGPMSEQILDEHQIGAVVQQVGGETVAKRVRRAAFFQACLDPRLAKDLTHGSRADRHGPPLAGEEPFLGLGDEPVTAEDVEQAWRYRSRCSSASSRGAAGLPACRAFRRCRDVHQVARFENFNLGPSFLVHAASLRPGASGELSTKRRAARFTHWPTNRCPEKHVAYGQLIAARPATPRTRENDPGTQTIG
jgi:hypothetical protein